MHSVVSLAVYLSECPGPLCYCLLRIILVCVLFMFHMQDASIALNDVSVVQVISMTPSLQFDVTAASVSADGHQLLLVGSSRQVCMEQQLLCSDKQRCHPLLLRSTAY